MSKCLHCGDCCKRMSPLNGGCCPNVLEVGTFYFCNDYENRPTECVNHGFCSRFCPIGLSVLGLDTEEKVHTRLMGGFETIKQWRGRDDT